MKFSLFYIPACQEESTPAHEFEELMEQCVAADELGFDTVFIAEHHFSRVGICPSPLMILTAIAQKTSRIRLGTGICVMSFHNPVHLAEQAALVDVLSGGRLELGVGRGSQPREFQGYDVPPSESRGRLKEGIKLLSRLLEGESVTFQGEYFSCAEAEIFPKPIQKPRPPIWIAGTSPETYAFAGQNDFNVLASGTFKGPSFYRDKMDYFFDAVRARGGNPDDYPAAIAHHIHVCDDPEAAWKQIEPAESWYLAYRSSVNAIEMPIEEKGHLKRNYSYNLNVREMIENGGTVGPPEKVIADIKRLREEFGINHLILFMLRGISQKDMLRSLELFSKEVMPVFQDEKVSS
ncbi:MAG: LLM class flavin-dependent oxidoreductase [bacterium]